MESSFLEKENVFPSFIDFSMQLFRFFTSIFKKLLDVYKRQQVIRRMNPMKNKSVATYKKSRLVLQCLYVNSEIYLNLLKKINRETEIAEKELRQTRKNKSLLRLLSLEKSLVYFTTSLKANEVVMERMNRGKVIKLYEEDEDLLEDVLIAVSYTHLLLHYLAVYMWNFW